MNMTKGKKIPNQLQRHIYCIYAVCYLRCLSILLAILLGILLGMSVLLIGKNLGRETIGGNGDAVHAIVGHVVLFLIQIS